MTTATNILASSVPGLDALLAGGISRNALVLVVGAPGAGKTVLSSQIIFNVAREGRKALIFTSYSEGNEQYLEHMSSFGFFDRSLVGDQIVLYTLQSQLRDGETPSASVMRSIRETGARIVLLDGLQGFSEAPGTNQSLRGLLAEIATQLRYVNATMLITLAGNARDERMGSELTVADSVIGLTYDLHGLRHRRQIEVVKLRGRAQLPGIHSYEVLASGVSIYPRVEVYPVPLQNRLAQERVCFNLPELDALLGGGLNAGTTTLIAGEPGTGKTTLALHWALTAARPEAMTLFVTFGEYQEQLEQKAQAFGLDLVAAQESGSVRVLRVPPVEVEPDRFSSLLLRELDATPVVRLVIDDCTVLFGALGARRHDYVAALNAILYGRGITSMYLLELRPFEGLSFTLEHSTVASLSENVILTQQVEVAGELRRRLAVLRLRFSRYDRTLRELVLEPNRVDVLPRAQSGADVLDQQIGLGGAGDQ